MAMGLPSFGLPATKATDEKRKDGTKIETASSTSYILAPSFWRPSRVMAPIRIDDFTNIDRAGRVTIAAAVRR